MTGLAIAIIVLLVIIVLIVGVLARPVTYSFSVEGEAPYGVDIHICWWGRLFSIHFAYAQGKPFFKEVYVLGKQFLGDAKDYQDWLSKRVKEETDHVQEGTDDLYSYAPPSESPATATIAPEGPAATGHIDAQGEDVSVQMETSDGDAAEDTPSWKDKIKAAMDALPKETPWWVHHLTNEALYEQLLIMGRHTYDQSKPRDVYVEGTFGLGDPYRTSLLASAMYTLWGEHMDRVEFDFLDYRARGRGHLKGRIYPLVMAWYGTLFVLSQPVRSLLADGVKAFMAHRKQKKQNKVANTHKLS